MVKVGLISLGKCALALLFCCMLMYHVSYQVSEEMLSMCKLSYMEHGNPISLEALCRKYGKCDTGNYTAYVDSCIQGVLKVNY